MRQLTTLIFVLLFITTFWTSIIVGITWLFNFYPSNLYNLWEISYKSFAVSLLFFILFGGKNK